MQALECPHCHQPGIPVWRKMCLGPATLAKCGNCGRAVSVPWSAIWAGTPFFAAIVIATFVSSTLVAAALWILGAAVMAWLYSRYVPLIAK
jgi:Flp pilus assembly protein TadB